MSEKTKEQIELEMLELKKNERIIYVAGAEDQCKFNKDERDYLRSDWKEQAKNQLQERTRRAIETCMSVTRNNIKDSTGQIPSNVKQTQDSAWDKAKELIEKLG